MRERAVVTGMGCITPLGNDVATTWENLCAGRSGIGPITRFDASDLETRFASEVRGFDPAARFGRKEAHPMDRFTQFAMAAPTAALAASKLKVDEHNRDRIGVFIGTGIGGVARLVEELEVLRTEGPAGSARSWCP